MTISAIIDSVRSILTASADRSAWSKGVKLYALELLDSLEESALYDGELPCNERLLRKALLNGASGWKEYSWGGCSLICDGDIAKRLCTATELKRTDGGKKEPSKNEQWLDVQARALFQASELVISAFLEG